MIDPNLEENAAEIDPNLEENAAEIAGTSISNAVGVSDKTGRHDEEVEALQDELESHARAMQEIHKKMISNKSASTALKNLTKNTIKKSTAKNRSSIQCQPHQPINREVKKLIEKEIIKNSKKKVNVAKTFGISDQQTLSFNQLMWCEIQAYNQCCHLSPPFA